MVKCRPGPRHAGFATVLLAAAMMMPAAHAASDTPESDGPADGAPAYRSAIADALSGEMAALTSFSSRDDFADAIMLHRIDPTQDTASRREHSSLALVDALNSQDIDTARRIAVAQAHMSVEQLLASLDDGIDALLLDRVKVTNPTPDWKCLSEALYFEARGEGTRGQLAVAEVILNRVDSDQYPDDVCSVVHQGAGSAGCQFSYNCDGKKEVISNKKIYKRIGKLAWLMLEGRPRNLTNDALYFHNTSVHPSWSRKYVKTARIGHHIFYRPEVVLTLR